MYGCCRFRNKSPTASGIISFESTTANFRNFTTPSLFHGENLFSQIAKGKGFNEFWRLRGKKTSLGEQKARKETRGGLSMLSVTANSWASGWKVETLCNCSQVILSYTFFWLRVLLPQPVWCIHWQLHMIELMMNLVQGVRVWADCRFVCFVELSYFRLTFEASRGKPKGAPNILQIQACTNLLWECAVVKTELCSQLGLLRRNGYRWITGYCHQFIDEFFYISVKNLYFTCFP